MFFFSGGIISLVQIVVSEMVSIQERCVRHKRLFLPNLVDAHKHSGQNIKLS